jgi:DNA-binding NarL/FixJ family response regulator
MRIVDKEHDLMDGEAIYLSGRGLTSLNDSSKESMTIECHNTHLTASLRIITLLTDTLINNLTQRQSEVILYKLLGDKEQQIASLMNITQAAVNNHASKAKWHSIEQAVNYVENQLNNI